MKFNIKQTKEVEIKTMRVDAGVRYWNDATMNGAEPVDDDHDDGNVNTDFPCRVGDDWRPVIDVETGKIINWVEGVTAEIHFKVCDAGTYELLDSEGVVLIKHEGYVPDAMCPVPNGFGDYIIMNVSADGLIEDFEFSLDGFNVESDE